MPRRQDAIDFFQKISLAQKISAKDKKFKEYVGSDTEIAQTIAVLNVLVEHKILDKNSAEIVKDILIEQNRAIFASSEKTDIFTKLGLLYPKGERNYGSGIKDKDQEDDDTVIIQGP